MRQLLYTAAFATLAASLMGGALFAQQNKTPSDADLIKSALSAAPEAVGRDAAVIVMDDKGAMKTIKRGTNNFTCIPDDPETPGEDPMCLDGNGMEWAMAWMNHTTPPAGKVGFGFMLKGGSDASNTDPFAKKPVAGQKWVDTGPHVMVFNPGPTMLAGYPRTPGDAKSPYVMWGGTPYEHLMIPVR